MTPEAQANKAFYDTQITKFSGPYAVLNGQAPNDAKQSYFSAYSAVQDGVKVVEMLPVAISVSSFIGGVRPTPGVDDFHVGAWLARIAFNSGVQRSEEGVSALEKRFGPLHEKVKASWAMRVGLAEGLPRQCNIHLHPRDLGPRRTCGTPKAWSRNAHYEQCDVRWCSTCWVGVAYSIVVLVHCHE